MGCYKRRTVRYSQTLNLSYRCSYCGKINRFAHTLTAVSGYRAGLFTDIEKHDAEARANAMIALDDKCKALKRAIEEQVYPLDKIKHYCDRCHYAEVWSRKKFPLGKVLCGCAVVCGGLAAVLGLCGRKPTAFWLLGFCLILSVASYAVNKWQERCYRKRLSELDDDCFPVLTEAEDAAE